MSAKRTFGRLVNDWLNEAPGEQLTDNKWKFWFVTLCGFQLLNSILTAVVFSAGGQLQNAMGAILLGVGALLAWLSVAFLHYSDSSDRRLARGVSLLDSITLVCVLAHFSFLAWTFGHLRTLQSAESRYEAQATAYNAKAERISADNTKIAEAAATVARETTKAERLRNDTMYQARRAAESGARITAPRSGATLGFGPALATSQIELERPTKPDKSSAAFLAKWDAWVRLANLAELILAAATLIYIRNRSAKTNAPRSPDMDFNPLLSVAARTPAAAPAFRRTHESYQQEKTRKTHESFNPEGLKRLREALKDISFRLRGLSFKAYTNQDAVWIRMMRANNSTQETVASAKATLEILSDAMTMERNAFRERLERFLKQNGFEL